MDLLRTWRTVRHLSASQLANRPVCRGKFVAMEKMPGPARRYFGRGAAALGPFDFASARLAATTAHVVQLQRAVHGRFLDGVGQGRFTLLNREIDFGGLDKVEWRRELGERNNRLWRMNLSYMGYLVPFVEREGAAAVPVVHRLLTSMDAQNPWSSRGVFRDVWHPYSVSHRVINLVTCLSLLAQASQPVSPEARAAIEAEIRLGTAFILGNLERDLQYNHLFKNFVCLAVVAAAQAGPARFAAGPLSEVAGSVAQQFLPDGGHAERAPMYHLLSLIDLRILHDSGALTPPNAAAVSHAMEGAGRVINVVTHPDGNVALFNDSWLQEAPPAAELTDRVVPRPAEPLRIEHPDIGYARLAQGGDGVILDYGPCGPDANPGHAHADFLSLELSVGGLRTLVDPGVPTYSEGEARNISRSAASHNGPCLVGDEPIEFWSSFRVGRRGYGFRLALDETAGDAVAGWQNGYVSGHGVRVARAVRLFPGRGLLVADLWTGPQGLPEQSSFLVARSWTSVAPGQFVCTDPGGTVAGFSVVPLLGTALPAEQGSYCLNFGLPETGTRIGFRPVAAHGARRLLLWFGWNETAAPDAEGRQLLTALEHALGAV